MKLILLFFLLSDAILLLFCFLFLTYLHLRHVSPKKNSYASYACKLKGKNYISVQCLNYRIFYKRKCCSSTCLLKFFWCSIESSDCFSIHKVEWELNISFRDIKYDMPSTCLIKRKSSDTNTIVTQMREFD